MKRNRLCSIIVCVLCFASAAVCAPRDSIYMGTQVKLDIASPILTPALNSWSMQHYEMAVNVRLARRWYPTVELGYAGGQRTQDTISYTGHGGFFRVGCDLNPLHRHPEAPHALLVGVRLGTSFQDFAQEVECKNIGTVLDRDAGGHMRIAGGRADCWGEIVAGCQVEIAKVNETAFYMGWMGRFKILFTRTELTNGAIYIPGFGKRDNIGWGVNYYLGWKF